MGDDPRKPAPPSRRLEWALAVLLCVGAALAIALGFFGGMKAVTYRFQRMIAEERRTETLLGGLKHVRMPAEDLPGILSIYGLKPGQEARLDAIAWVPPGMPAPFVGAIARPGRFANAEINPYGFRDRRNSYLPKPSGVFRVFVTGGSTAFGSGAESDDATIAGQLEALLNRDQAPSTGRRYEVVTAAIPAWSTTHERILIENRIVELGPDRIVMFSGFNDVLWGEYLSDTHWFFTFYDQHYVSLLNQVQQRVGLPPLGPVRILEASRPDCATIARRAARNVVYAAFAAAQVNAELVFALQPNVFSTGKTLTQRERRVRDRQPEWPARFNACYAELRRALGAIAMPGHRFLDLSALFADLPAERELFIDTSHFAGAGNAIVARELAKALEWR
jgi:lysophospholipase L1-like esterase